MAKQRAPQITNETGIIPFTTALDQPVKVPSVEALFRQIDDTVQYAIDSHNPSPALDAIEKLMQAQKLSGLGLARIIGKMAQSWESFGMEETFEIVASERLGLAGDTIRRYAAVYEMLQKTEESYGSEFLGLAMERPMKDLIAIAQAEARHGKFTKSSMRKLLNAPDNASLRDALAEETGREPSASKLLVLRLRKDGTLTARKGNRTKSCGMLPTAADRDDPLIAEAVARLVASAHIQED